MWLWSRHVSLLYRSLLLFPQLSASLILFSRQLLFLDLMRSSRLPFPLKICRSEARVGVIILQVKLCVCTVCMMSWCWMAFFSENECV